MVTIPNLNEKIFNEMKNLTARQAISLIIDKEKEPKITDSKFGGLPYWNMELEYPRRSDGTLLMLLAQINLEQLNQEGKNPDGKLPKSGMLQFFIDSNDDLFGVDSSGRSDQEGRLIQDGFRVVLHKVVDYGVSEEQIQDIGMPISTDEEIEDTPVWGEYGLAIQLQETYIGADDYRFETYFHQAAKAVGWEVEENNEEDEMIDAVREFFYEEWNPDGHWMLGYPYFTQFDPREEMDGDKSRKVYDIQLFQMDSDYDDHDDCILWGDAGVANFFINEKDLEKEDFRDILYTWDCC